MSQNSNSIPLDDEDILDLTIIAEPGKEDAPDGSPEPGSAFDADLDALLDSLATDSTADGAAPSAPAPRPAPPAPVAAPIADQTPADHVVDPNEELTMPEMADIDSLLAELGADLPAEQPSARTPAPKPETPVPAPAASAPMREFENILAQAQAAETQKAAEEAAAPAKPVQANQPSPVTPAADPAVAAAAAVPAPAPAPPAPVAPITDAPAPSPPGQGAPAGSETETADLDPADSLDLNELDALLDDILATAPEVVSPAPREPAPAPAAVKAAPPAETIPVPDQALMTAETSGLAERLQRVEDALLVIEGKDEWHRVEALEEIVNKLEARESGLGETEVTSMVEARIVALLEPGSMLMRTIVSEVLAALSGKEEAQSDAFRGTLEKMAAAAAAKVIREEIAAIMNEG